MNDDSKILALAGIGIAVGWYLLSRAGSAAGSAASSPVVWVEEQLPDRSDLPETIRTWEPLGLDGEVGRSSNDVVYDDPEVGPENDEPEDDTNVTFQEANTVDSVNVDPTSYAPDTTADGQAPSTGVIADPGDSQNFGRAPEQENDDLTERAADSEMDDRTKAAFDRLANYDSVDSL